MGLIHSFLHLGTDGRAHADTGFQDCLRHRAGHDDRGGHFLVIRGCRCNDRAKGRVNRITEHLADANLDVEYSVEGYTSRDVAFDIVQTARNNDADIILMEYPKEHPAITAAVEYKAPCDVVFVSGFKATEDIIETVTVGAGGGPHHRRSLSARDWAHIYEMLRM